MSSVLHPKMVKMNLSFLWGGEKLCECSNEAPEIMQNGSLIFFCFFFLPFFFWLGFVEARKGCCGTGTVETTSLLCNPKSLGGTCSNSTQYVFWDSVHPSEAANQVLADALILQGFALL